MTGREKEWIAADAASVAIFMDRDGVLNRLIHNPLTGEFESPHCRGDFHLIPGTLAALRRLQQRGVSLFLVSNQPSYALGKTTLEEIQAIQDDFRNRMLQAGIQFRAFYYCYHHPQGTVEGYSGACGCRKPSPFFLRQAEKEFRIRLSNSWMIGDRDSDVQCGQQAGCRTVLIEYPESAPDRGKSQPDYIAPNFASAVRLLENLWDCKGCEADQD